LINNRRLTVEVEVEEVVDVVVVVEVVPVADTLDEGLLLLLREGKWC
jgi:hypothetical protein